MDISLKRVVAYLIDIVLVTLIATLITNVKVFNPYYERYNENYDKYAELLNKYRENEIDEEEYQKEFIPLNYELSKDSTIAGGVTIALLVAYFGIYQGLAGGQTIGKKMMKIKIVGTKAEKVNAGLYILRCVILNNIIFRILLLIGPFITNASTFNTFSYVIEILEGAVECAIFVMIMLRKDGRGLHDYLAGTKVISTVPVVMEEAVTPKEEKVEPKVIEAKETTNKKTPKSSKTSKSAKTSSATKTKKTTSKSKNSNSKNTKNQN